MSNRIPKYQRVKDCQLYPWDNYKTNKFADKSTGSRLSKIKNCAGKGTANGTFKGSGRMNAQGFANVQGSSTRTSTLANVTIRCTENQVKGEKVIRNCKPIFD